MLSLEGRCYSTVSQLSLMESRVPECSRVRYSMSPPPPPTPVLDLDLGRKYIYTTAWESTDWHDEADSES